jgi:hypothetical protein
MKSSNSVLEIILALIISLRLMKPHGYDANQHQQDKERSEVFNLKIG